MKNFKNYYLLAYVMLIGIVFTGCNINSVDEIPPTGDISISLQSTSTYFDLTDAVGDVVFDVVISSATAADFDRTVIISVDESSTSSVTEYSFTGNIVIPAGELTAKTALTINSDVVSINSLKTLTLVLDESSLDVTYEKFCATNDIVLNINFDDYGSETTWDIKDNSDNSTVFSGGPYTNTDTTYQEIMTLLGGEYTFTIYDAYGDGICCNYGEGSYTLDLSGCPLNIVTGGSFAASQSTTFSIP